MRADAKFFAVLISALAVVAGASASAGSATAGQARALDGDSYGRVWNILPPGSDGTIGALDLLAVGPSLTATGTTPTNVANQLEMYDALTKTAPGALEMADVNELYKRETFEPAEVVSTKSPKAGVTIERDAFGVPYITGTTSANVAFGAGYAAVEDRMFLMDVLRHTGAAQMVAFLGDTPANVKMDQDQLAAAPYTRQEATAQVALAAKRAGADEQRFLNAADAFIAGINKAQKDMCPLIVAPSCPAEYLALQKTVKDWGLADLTYVASLVGGIFGKGGGQEYENAIWLQRLMKKFGATEGKAIYDDLREKNDVEAPTTASNYTPYDLGKVKPNQPGVAMPDLGGEVATGSGADVSGGLLGLRAAESSEPVDPAVARLQQVGKSVRLALRHRGMSNAVLLGAKHTDSGHPIAVMGPQTGYFAPQLLVEQVLKGPRVYARGVSFAGTNVVVQLGRGVDYAWSATSAGSDNVDTVAERLCNMDGSKPTVESIAYRKNGKCVPMDRWIHQETALPNITAPGLPKVYKFEVLRTHHGPVKLRTTVDGKPVALVTERSTYGHEIDSIIGFARLNDPTYVKDAASFQRAASGIDYTFNWFYADDKDISYYSSGLLPRRADGTDTDLPRWGDKKYDWNGWIGFDRHARQTNPPSGYLVSWNNKQAPGFAAADTQWGFGSVHRSLALEDRLVKEMNEGKLTIPEMVGVMSGGATADSRAAYTLPWLLKVIGVDPATADARALLKKWLAGGAHRVDRDRDGAYAHEAAIALFDTWWEDGSEAVAYDVMESRLGANLVRKLPTLLDDHPRLGQGSSFIDIAWYGYINKDLRDLLGKSVGSPYTFSYCGSGSLAACRTALRASLAGAVDRALEAQGVASVNDLTFDKSIDNIVSQTGGVVGVREIDWQNRPTFQQVVAFDSHR